MNLHTVCRNNSYNQKFSIFKYPKYSFSIKIRPDFPFSDLLFWPENDNFRIKIEIYWNLKWNHWYYWNLNNTEIEIFDLLNKIFKFQKFTEIELSNKSTTNFLDVYISDLKINRCLRRCGNMIKWIIKPTCHLNMSVYMPSRLFA